MELLDLDGFAENRPIKLRGEVLHIPPITVGFSERFQKSIFKVMQVAKNEKDADTLDPLELNNIILEYLNSNIECIVFEMQYITNNIPSKVLNALLKTIAEDINDIEKK